MKIALVDLYTNGHHLKYAGELIEYLQKKQHKVIFITRERDEKIDHFVSIHPNLKLRTIYKKGAILNENREISSRRAFMRYFFLKTFGDLRTYYKAFKIAEEWKAKILHLLYVDTNFIFSLYLLTLKSWSFKIIGTIFRLFISFEYNTKCTNLLDLLKKTFRTFNSFLFKLMIQKDSFDAIIHHNIYPQKLEEKVKDKMNWTNYYRDKFLFLYEPIYDDFLKYSSEFEARQKLDLPKDIPILLCFGAFLKNKGLDILLEALKKVRNKICLVIAGEPIHFSKNYINRNKKQLMNLHVIVDHLFFIPEENIPYYFLSADAVIMPYRRQYYDSDLVSSGVLMQALSARKPIICSDVGLIGKFVKEKSLGIVLTPESVYNLAEGIMNFISKKEEIKRNVQSLAENYIRRADWNKVASQIEERYKKSIQVC